MTVAKITDVSGGLNTDMPAWELPPGVWTTAINVRFPPGRIENWKGAQSFITPTVNPQVVCTYSSATEDFIVYAGTQKLYAFYNASEFEITRFTEGVTISSITRVGTTATLTTASNHGRTTGDTVSVWGALPSQYNGTFVITVTGATTFTYTMSSDPGASASPVGQYTYNSTNDFTFSAARTTGARISFSSIGNVLFVNHPTDGLYWWDGRTGSSDVRVRKVPTANIADCSRTFKSFVIQLAPTISGTRYKDRVVWSKSFETNAIPSTFTAASDNDAGYLDLSTTAGDVIECIPFGDLNLVFKSDSIWAMQYVDGQKVFSFNMIWGNDGIAWRDQAVDIGRGIVYLSSDFDVKLFNGSTSESIAEGVVLDSLRTEIASYGPKSVILIKDPVNSEIIVGIGGATSYLWNWRSNKWSTISLPGAVVCGCTGDVPSHFSTTYTHTLGSKTILANSTGVGAIPVGSQTSRDFMGSSLAVELKKSYLDVSQIDKSAFGKSVELQRSRWNFKTSGAVGAVLVTLKHGSSLRAGGTESLTSGKTYLLSSDDFSNNRTVEGHYLYLEAVSNIQKDFKLRSIDIDYKIGGEQ